MQLGEPPLDAERRIAAPALRETADIWFDTDRDPVVEWSADRRRFDLVDPGARDNRIELFTSTAPVFDCGRVAEALAEGLAACDFPPTGDGAHRRHVEKALRAAGIDPHAP